MSESPGSALAEQLPLFNVGNIDLSLLRRMSDGIDVRVHSPRTKEAYTYAWNFFADWCAGAGLESLPCAPDTLKLYVMWLLMVRNLKVSTADHHIAAITDRHRAAAFPSPRNAVVTNILAAVKRDRKERPEGKAAITPADLVRVAGCFDATTAIGARDRAIFVLGFATSLRRSEIARLEFRDIMFEKRGLAVAVRYSKTDQQGRGRVIGVWAGRRENTDPVRVLKAWIRKRGSWDGPLFPVTLQGEIGRKAVTGETVLDVVKRAIARAGLDPAKYGAHSLRAGAVTAAAELGRSDQEIMRLSGHESAQVMRMYVRSARLFSGRNPLAGVL